MSDLQALINKYFSLGLPTYSRSLDAALAVPMQKGTPEQISSMLLKYGAAPDELARTGVNDLIQNAGSRVNMDDVLNQISNNQVPTKDYVAGLMSPGDMNVFSDAAEKEISGLPREDYYKYTLNGGTMGRYSTDDTRAKYLLDKYNITNNPRYELWATPNPDDTAAYAEHVISMPGVTNYTSPHFDGNEFGFGQYVPDYHSHMRYQTFDTDHGKKMLLLDELQSDLSQDLRNQSANNRFQVSVEGEPPEFMTMEQLNGLRDNDIPFEVLSQPTNAIKKPPLAQTQDWTKYLLKRAMQIGADKNVDQIGFTQGAQQAARYGNDPRTEGVVNFYNNIVPKVSQQLIKKYGGKMGESHIPSYAVKEDSGIPVISSSKQIALPVHSFDLTPQMKEDLLTKGISLYNKGGEVHSNLAKYEEMSHG